MDNIFQIGGQVSGASFIGRKKLLEKFRRIYLEESSRVCKSIVGLTRIGKSSFACELFSQIPDKIILIKEDLKEISSYAELWQDISFTLDEKLKEKNMMTLELNEYLSVLNSFNDVPWIKFIRYVKKTFLKIKEACFKVIILFDEFDYAQELFKNETKYYELFRTLFSSPEYNISALLISRRSLNIIEDATYQSSTFHGIFDPVQFPGFEDEDLKEFFSVFDRYGIKLEEEDRSTIEFYAGRLPYLLSILGHYIVDGYAFKNTKVSIHELFMTKCRAINDYYRDCIKHLERDDDLKRIIPFVIGPNLGVSKNDKDELISSGYLIVRNNTFIPISEYFKSFLTVNKINFPLGVGITTVETRLKEIVKNENLCTNSLRLNDQNTAAEFLTGIIKLNEESINRYTNYITSDKKIFCRDSTFLDVMSLNHVIKIVKLFWNSNFSKYFNNDPLNTWGYKLDQCAKARNPVQHAHEDYYSETEKFEIDNYCKQIIDCLAGTSGISKSAPSNRNPLSTDSVDKIKNEKSNDRIKHNINKKPKDNKSNEIMDVAIKEILVEVTEYNPKTMKLRGVPVTPVSKSYSVAFEKTSLPDDFKKLVGKTCLCEISNINDPQKIYVVRYIKIHTDNKKDM